MKTRAAKNAQQERDERTKHEDAYGCRTITADDWTELRRRKAIIVTENGDYVLWPARQKDGLPILYEIQGMNVGIDGELLVELNPHE